MNKKAFTLIELLVVVLIIGILAAVALPQYEKAVMKSRFTQLKILVSAVVQAEEAYYLANGAYTNDIDALDISLPTPDSKEGDRVFYPWGSCNIVTVAAGCNNPDIGLRYTAYYVHTTQARAGKQECAIDKTKPYTAQLCQNETGQATPFWEEGDAAAYSY